MVIGNPKVLVTSDVGAQIRMLRQEDLKAKELAEQKQARNLLNLKSLFCPVEQ